MKVEMKGLEELQEKLNQMASDEAKQIENKALTESADYLVEKIKEGTPVRYGDLQESITEGEVVNGKIQVGPSQQGPAFRAHFIEFGTKYMRAQPFMRPAFEVSKDKLIKIMGDEIRKGLKL